MKKIFVKLSPREPYGEAIFIQNEYLDDTQPLYQADCEEDYGGLGVSSSDMSSPDILRSPIQKSDSIFSLAGDRAKVGKKMIFYDLDFQYRFPPGMQDGTSRMLYKECLFYAFHLPSNMVDIWVSFLII